MNHSSSEEEEEEEDNNEEEEEEEEEEEVILIGDSDSEDDDNNDNEEEEEDNEEEEEEEEERVVVVVDDSEREDGDDKNQNEGFVERDFDDDEDYYSYSPLRASADDEDDDEEDMDDMDHNNNNNNNDDDDDNDNDNRGEKKPINENNIKNNEVISIGSSSSDEEEDNDEEGNGVLELGAKVLLHGLTIRVDWNGLNGTVEKYLFQNRYSVSFTNLDNQKEVAALEGANLCDINKNGERAMTILLQMKEKKKMEEQRKKATQEEREEVLEEYKQNERIHKLKTKKKELELIDRKRARNDDHGEEDQTTTTTTTTTVVSVPRRNVSMIIPRSRSNDFTFTNNNNNNKTIFPSSSPSFVALPRPMPYEHPVYDENDKKLRYKQCTCVIDSDLGKDWAEQNFVRSLTGRLENANFEVKGVPTNAKRLFFESRTLLRIPSSITWIRHPENYVVNPNLSEAAVDLDPNLNWAKRTVLILTAKEFCDLLDKEEETETKRKIQDGSLSDILQRAKRGSDAVGVLTLLAYGFDKYCHTRETKEVADFKRRGLSIDKAFKKSSVSERVAQLIIRSGGFGNLGKIRVKFSKCDDMDAALNTIVSMHRYVAELPYKEIPTAISVGANIFKGKVTYQDGAPDNRLSAKQVDWANCLIKLPDITGKHAHNIIAQFPSPRSLIEHLKNHTNDSNVADKTIVEKIQGESDRKIKFTYLAAEGMRKMFSPLALKTDTIPKKRNMPQKK